LLQGLVDQARAQVKSEKVSHDLRFLKMLYQLVFFKLAIHLWGSAEILVGQAA